MRRLTALLLAACCGVSCATEVDAPEPVVAARRVGLRELDRSLSHLFGPTRISPRLPKDDLGGDFDNPVGLLVSPLFLDAYERAVEQLVEEALGLRPLAPNQRFEAESLANVSGFEEPGTGTRLIGPSEIQLQIGLSHAGRYRIGVRAWAVQSAEPISVRLVQDFEPVALLSVGAEHEEQFVELEVETPRSMTLRLVSEEPFPEDPERYLSGPAVVVDWLSIEAIGLNGAQDLIAACPEPTRGTTACAEQVLSSFGQRAWRRPLGADELAELRAMYEARAPELGFGRALAVALRAILLAPDFVFRIERSDPSAPDRVDALSLASRLSFFLWQSPPDDALLASASSGALEDHFDQEVDRMLADPRSSSLVDGFVSQWLRLAEIEQTQMSQTLYPEADGRLLRSMRAEADQFFLRSLEDEDPIEALVISEDLFIDARLAEHYGLPPPSGGEGWGRQEGRAGVLTLGGVLTALSQPTRASPTRRGRFVLEQLLCSPVGEPISRDATVTTASVGEAFREELADRTRVEPCRGCHEDMDALGAALDGYDAIGRQVAEAGPDARFFGTPISSARELGAAIAEDPRFASCVASKLGEYARGRPGMAPAADASASLKDLVRSIALDESMRRFGGEP